MEAKIREEIPESIQNELGLDNIKREVIKNLPWDSKAVVLLTQLSPQEIFEVIPMQKGDDENKYGILFENIAKLIKQKNLEGNPKLVQLDAILTQLFKSDLIVSYFPGTAAPDFIEVNENFEIVSIYECKVSKRAISSTRKGQVERETNAINKIIELTHDSWSAPNKLKPYLDQINKITDRKLKLANDFRFVYIFPDNLRNFTREQVNQRKGLFSEFLPLTQEDAKSISNTLTSLTGNSGQIEYKEKEVLSSSFRRKKANG